MELLDCLKTITDPRRPQGRLYPYAFLKLSPEALEAAFREHSAALAEEPDDCIAVAGKALKGSFDAMADRHAAQVLSAFTHTQQIILGHIPIAEKSNEIPAAQKLIEELGLKGRVFTLAAPHCQKNFRGRSQHGQPSHRSNQRQPAEAAETSESACS
jgi:hypothetical protein